MARVLSCRAYLAANLVHNFYLPAPNYWRSLSRARWLCTTSHPHFASGLTESLRYPFPGSIGLFTRFESVRLCIDVLRISITLPVHLGRVLGFPVSWVLFCSTVSTMELLQTVLAGTPRLYASSRFCGSSASAACSKCSSFSCELDLNSIQHCCNVNALRLLPSLMRIQRMIFLFFACISCQIKIYCTETLQLLEPERILEQLGTFGVLEYMLQCRKQYFWIFCLLIHQPRFGLACRLGMLSSFALQCLFQVSNLGESCFVWRTLCRIVQERLNVSHSRMRVFKLFFALCAALHLFACAFWRIKLITSSTDTLTAWLTTHAVDGEVREINVKSARLFVCW